MKNIFLYLCIVLFASCNKSDFLNGVNFEKFLLSGSGNYHNTEHTWYLDSLVINNVPFKLTQKEKLYNKTFYSNGSFTDSDGYSGKWDIANIDDLSISIKNTLTGTYTESKLKIIDINSFRFSYSLIGLNNTKYDYYFKISYE
jgi:hypothetical protein